MRVLNKYIQEIFSVDLRSLALLRIGTGILIIIDLIMRWNHLVPFYTDQGVLPTEYVRVSNPHLFSLHFYAIPLLFHHLLFFIMFIFALLLVIGYRTRYITPIMWGLLLSLQNRNYLLNYGADAILALLLFWGIFLPWGARLSIDSAHHRLTTVSQKMFSLATFGFGLQIGLIYIATSLLKRSPVWINEGSGVYFALKIGQYETLFGKFLLQFPALLWLLNYLVLFTEFIAIFVLFWPYKNGLIRSLFLFILIGMHIGFGLGLTLELFSFVMVTMLIGYLPTWFWDTVKKSSFSYLKIPTFLKKAFFPTNQKQNTSIQVIKHSVWSKVLLSVMIFNMVLMVVLSFSPPISTFTPLYKFNSAIQFMQNWNFFAPKPIDYTLWFVIEGKLSNGITIDLRTRTTTTFLRPENVSATYNGLRWKNYFFNAERTHTSFLPYAQYLCRQWNQNNKEQVTEITIISLKQQNSFPYKDMPITKEVEIITRCL